MPLEGRAVAHNIFLDGNTFGNSPSVDKKLLVGDLQFGVAVTFSNMRVAYTHVLATEEFHGQGRGDAYGSFSFSFRF